MPCRTQSNKVRGLTLRYFAPFGEQYATSGTADASFTGQDQDTLSSLYDFPASRLSPSQGRWISPNPAGIAAVSLDNPQSWNRYGYISGVAVAAPSLGSGMTTQVASVGGRPKRPIVVPTSQQLQMEIAAVESDGWIGAPAHTIGGVFDQTDNTFPGEFNPADSMSSNLNFIVDGNTANFEVPPPAFFQGTMNICSPWSPSCPDQQNPGVSSCIVNDQADPTCEQGILGNALDPLFSLDPNAELDEMNAISNAESMLFFLCNDQGCQNQPVGDPTFTTQDGGDPTGSGNGGMNPSSTCTSVICTSY